MKESYGEGVANHTGPESCGVGSNDRAEALAGVHAGQVWSREILIRSRVLTLWTRRKATPGASVTRETPGPCAVEGLGHAWKHLTREPGDPIFASRRRVGEAALGSLRT
jgi:hypothetical protein